jgi:hypothetical protein
MNRRILAVAALLFIVVGLFGGFAYAAATNQRSDNTCEAAEVWVADWVKEAEKAGIDKLDTSNEAHVDMALMYWINYNETHEAPELLAGYIDAVTALMRQWLEADSLDDMIAIDTTDLDTERTKIVNACGADSPIVTEYIDS